MKKYIFLIALIAAASTVAVLINCAGDSDQMNEEFAGDSMMNYLGV
jgi:hypothetical protein